MPNSIAIADVSILLQDGLQSSIPPVIFRTVPPVKCPSNLSVQYSGYSVVNPSVPLVIISSGTQSNVNFPFVYVRNAGSVGNFYVDVAFGAFTGSYTSRIPLTPGGVFLFTNTGYILKDSNAVVYMDLTVFGTNGALAEWLIAQ